MPPTQTAIFAANLRALRRVNKELAQRVEEAAPADVQWTQTPTGAWSASLEHQGRTLQLASRFDPAAEAQKLTESVDFVKHAGAAVLGLGLGYHVLELAQRGGAGAILIVYEPDVALLRAALEKIDHTPWLNRPTTVLVDRDDRADLLARLEKFSSYLTQGTVLVTHPPTRQRFGPQVQAFSQLVTELLQYFRVHIATALVNATRTIENLCANIAHYAAGANTDELYQAALGKPAVCVSAGPSLAKNVDLLRDQEVRKRVVIITTQTTLKPLIERGIRPDFVTALDYHEISRRFYENLPPLEDVTLVFEAKGHPSILENFPGPARVAASGFLSKFLGPAAPPIRPIPQGSTVAHLSFYLAQHLGCDPIMFIGQDLGFSDGLYYCPGTAIHEVWAPELSPWNTLEMMEWQRIVRHRGNLQKLPDIHGREIYTDEQMVTYLQQFERDFASARETIIDATEGGLPKAHTTRMTLRAALDKYAVAPVPELPRAGRTLDPARLAAARKQVERRQGDLDELERLTRVTLPLLKEMMEHQHDKARSERLYEKIQKNRRAVDDLGETFALVNDLNSIGVYNRSRADRVIEQAQDADPFVRQRKQLERDQENLQWLLQAFAEARRTFRLAHDRLK